MADLLIEKKVFTFFTLQIDTKTMFLIDDS